MKNRAHLLWLILAVSFAGLTTGCVTSERRTVQRIEPANEIEVVETSAARPLTEREMGELRATVARYLDQQGATGTGDYYLKVYLTPETEGATPEWVVVRFTRYSDVRVNVASTYPAYDDPYSSSYYSYDLYPYGYGGFGRIAFQYYDDPFYGRRYYYPRYDHRSHDHPNPPPNRPPSGKPPGGVVTNPPPRPPDHRRHRPVDRIAPDAPRPETAARPPGTGTPGGPNRPLNANNPSPRPPPRAGEPDRQWRGRNENNSGGNAPRPQQPFQPRPETRSEAPRSSPPPSRAPDRVAPAASSSGGNREVRDDGKKSAN